METTTFRNDPSQQPPTLPSIASLLSEIDLRRETTSSADGDTPLPSGVGNGGSGNGSAQGDSSLMFSSPPHRAQQANSSSAFRSFHVADKSSASHSRPTFNSSSSRVKEIPWYLGVFPDGPPQQSPDRQIHQLPTTAQTARPSSKSNKPLFPSQNWSNSSRTQQQQQQQQQNPFHQSHYQQEPLISSFTAAAAANGNSGAGTTGGPNPRPFSQYSSSKQNEMDHSSISLGGQTVPPDAQTCLSDPPARPQHLFRANSILNSPDGGKIQRMETSPSPPIGGGAHNMHGGGGGGGGGGGATTGHRVSRSKQQRMHQKNQGNGAPESTFSVGCDQSKKFPEPIGSPCSDSRRLFEMYDDTFSPRNTTNSDSMSEVSTTSDLFGTLPSSLELLRSSINQQRTVTPPATNPIRSVSTSPRGIVSQRARPQSFVPCSSPPPTFPHTAIDPQHYTDDSFVMDMVEGKPAPPYRKRKTKEWRDEDMATALQLVKEGKLSARAAAIQYNVPRSTLWDRVAGRVTHGIDKRRKKMKSGGGDKK